MHQQRRPQRGGITQPIAGLIGPGPGPRGLGLGLVTLGSGGGLEQGGAGERVGGAEPQGALGVTPAWRRGGEGRGGWKGGGDLERERERRESGAAGSTHLADQEREDVVARRVGDEKGTVAPWAGEPGRKPTARGGAARESAGGAEVPGRGAETTSRWCWGKGAEGRTSPGRQAALGGERAAPEGIAGVAAAGEEQGGKKAIRASSGRREKRGGGQGARTSGEDTLKI